MSIFFPDNDKRQKRLVELASDTQNFLSSAKDSYREFIDLNNQVNTKIAAVYAKANLRPPTTSSIDVLGAQKSLQGIETGSTVVDVSKLLLDLGGVAAAALYFAPAATSLLVDGGFMAAETASTVLFSVLGAELTVGALAGGIIGGLVVGVIVVGIGLAIDAIEGAHERDELRHGIYQMDQARASMKFALDKGQALVDMLKSVVTTCNSLLSEGIALSEAIINNLIQKNALPALKAIEAITKNLVIGQLKALDSSRHSWTEEDQTASSLRLPVTAPIYINGGIDVPASSVPAIPSGLKLTALADPNRLDGRPKYPILRVDNVSYWPFSYIDNRVGMAIVAFDGAGRQVKRWDKTGARYIWKIEQDVGTNDIVFVGQSEQKVKLSWAELTDLTFDTTTMIPQSACPAIPAGLKLASLSDPDKLTPAPRYPTLSIGNVRYWPLSFIDNRDAMAIVAFDSSGKLMKRWDKTGARYIWKIEEDLGPKRVTFLGQGKQGIAMTYAELTSF